MKAMKAVAMQKTPSKRQKTVMKKPAMTPTMKRAMKNEKVGMTYGSRSPIWRDYLLNLNGA